MSHSTSTEHTRSSTAPAEQARQMRLQQPASEIHRQAQRAWSLVYFLDDAGLRALAEAAANIGFALDDVARQLDGRVAHG